MLTIIISVAAATIATAVVMFLLFWRLFFIPVAELLVAFADAYPREFDRDPKSQKMIADIRAMLKHQGK